MRLFRRVPVLARVGLSAGIAEALPALSGAGRMAAATVGWAGSRGRAERGWALGRAERGWSSLRQTLLRVAGVLLAGAGLLP